MSNPMRSSALFASRWKHCAVSPRPLTVNCLLRLPSETRASLYHHVRVAQFHASSSRRQATVTTASEATADAAHAAPSLFENTVFALLENLHAASGLPWAYTIPLSAILIRGLLLPWAVADRNGQQRYFDLQPLLAAWKTKIRDVVYYQHARTKDGGWLRREHERLLSSRRGELLARWDAGVWYRSSFILAQLPVFIGVATVYRRMCGADAGFAGWLLAKLPVIGSRGTEAGIAQPLFDPSLAHEGMLWFPDLLQPDPWLGLGILTAVMNVSMLVYTTSKVRRAGPRHVPLSPWRKVVLNAGTLLSFAIIPISTSLPAGMMLYWASSTAATVASNLALDVVLPLQAAPTPCKKRAKVEYKDTKDGNN